jgi:hypothetical protein
METEFKILVVLTHLLLICTSFFAGMAFEKTFGEKRVKTVEVKNAR